MKNTFILCLIASAVAVTSCRADTDETADPPVLIAVGDIAVCGEENDEATAGLVDDLPGTIAMLGDAAYESGSAQEFANCYDPSWGRHRDRTRPAVGNHDYDTSGAEPYFDYFGDLAGEPGKGWYSYDLGAWHIVVLNSECAEAGGCGENSEQGRWLAADLEAHQSLCTLAYWHTPRFALDGLSPRAEDLEYFWEILYEHGADLILNGHDHFYARFARLNPLGEQDEERGIRQFIVGTGGVELYGLTHEATDIVEKRNHLSYGVLQVTLHDNRYGWEFVRSNGWFRDTGEELCHAP